MIGLGGRDGNGRRSKIVRSGIDRRYTPAARVTGMAELIAFPVTIEAAGDPPKLIEEYAGRASTGEERVSVARPPAFSPDTVHRDPAA
jgi:hypothetical protein